MYTRERETGPTTKTCPTCPSNDSARALECNGVAAGTIKRLRSTHLEADDLFGGGADMPAKQSQAMIRAAAKTGHFGDDGKGDA